MITLLVLRVGLSAIRSVFQLLSNAHIYDISSQIRPDSPPRNTETRTVGSHALRIFEERVVIEVRNHLLFGPSRPSSSCHIREGGEPMLGTIRVDEKKGGDGGIREANMMFGWDCWRWGPVQVDLERGEGPIRIVRRFFQCRKRKDMLGSELSFWLVSFVDLVLASLDLRDELCFALVDGDQACAWGASPAHHVLTFRPRAVFAVRIFPIPFGRADENSFHVTVLPPHLLPPPPPSPTEHANNRSTTRP